jgi:hypothetical protein
MDANILRHLGEVAGIGGLALGVFLILFREVIRKRIFPTLSKEHAYRIIRLFLVLTFVLAALGLGAWIFAEKRQAGFSDSKLAIVDIGLARNPNQASGFPALDLKVRNTGDTSAFLKRARVDVIDRLTFTDCSAYSAKEATWTYELSVDNPKSIELSQEVPPRGVDRFLIVVGHSLRGAPFHAFYRLRLVLISDEDNKELTSNDFTLFLNGIAAREASSTFGRGPFADQCFEDLQKKLEAVHSWPVAYSMPDYFKDDRK